MRMLRPSAHPSVCSPSRNAAKRACPRGSSSPQPHQHPDPPDLTRLLRLSGDRTSLARTRLQTLDVLRAAVYLGGTLIQASLQLGTFG